MCAIQEKIDPVTTRRQAKNNKSTLCDRQMEKESDAKIHDGPVRIPRIPHLPSAGSKGTLSDDKGIHYTEDLELALSHGRAVWRIKKPSQLGRQTSPKSSNLSKTVKRKKISAIDQVAKDRKFYEPPQAISPKLPDLGSQLEVSNDDLQVPSDKVSKQDNSTRSSHRAVPSPSRDFRVTGHDLQRLMKSTPPQDYRAISSDLQKLFNNNSSSNIDDDDLRQKVLQGGPTVGNLTVDHISYLSASGVSSSSALNASTPRRLGIQGTSDHPIEILSSSEDEDAADDADEDVNMNCHESPTAEDTPILSRDCAVCSDSVDITAMPSLPRCVHQAATCAVCFAHWIESQLATKGWKAIACPNISCKVILTYYEVQAYATPEVFAQFDMYSMRDALGQVANFRWCNNPACTSGQEHDDDGYIFTCVACGHKTCVTHNVDWHEGETCDEYTYRVSGAKEREQRDQEEASIATINQLSKKCPGPDCAFNIEKNEGCNHMTCSRCRYEFCWECLADYQKIRRNGNTAHEKTCMYHSSRLV